MEGYVQPLAQGNEEGGFLMPSPEQAHWHMVQAARNLAQRVHKKEVNGSSVELLIGTHAEYVADLHEQQAGLRKVGMEEYERELSRLEGRK